MVRSIAARSVKVSLGLNTFVIQVESDFQLVTSSPLGGSSSTTWYQLSIGDKGMKARTADFALLLSFHPANSAMMVTRLTQASALKTFFVVAPPGPGKVCTFGWLE